jgi:anti-anti-sigma factor
MQHDNSPRHAPSRDGDRPAGPGATGHAQWSSPVSAAIDWDLMHGVLNVRIAGELCTWSARRIEPEIQSALDTLDPREIHIDVSGLTFLDARGVSLLVLVRSWARERGRRSEIAGSSETTRRMLTLCGFDAPSVIGVND